MAKYEVIISEGFALLDPKCAPFWDVTVIPEGGKWSARVAETRHSTLAQAEAAEAVALNEWNGTHAIKQD